VAQVDSHFLVCCGDKVPALQPPVQFRIQIVDGPSFSCPTDRSVLQAAAALQLKAIRQGCFGGGCGICRVRLISGQYRCGRMSRARVSVYEQQQGLTLACQLYPLSDLTLIPMPWALNGAK
jgi:ferredoxin